MARTSSATSRSRSSCPDDVVIADRPAIGQLIHAYERTHSSVVAVMRGARRRRSRATASSPPRSDESHLDGGRLRRMTAIVEKPDAGGRAVDPRGHRALRPDAQDLRQARADPARRRWRDPADRRDRGAHGRAVGLHLRVRGRPLRRRDDDGLAPGDGRPRAPAARPRARSSAPTCGASTSADRRACHGRAGRHDGRPARVLRYDARRAASGGATHPRNAGRTA